jgi:hypothetical protein
MVGNDDTEWRVIEQHAYDREGPTDLTTAILEAVAAAEGTDATAIKEPLLYEVVDTTAIEDGFFGPTVAGNRRDAVGTVQFHYREFRVTVRSDGWVQIAEPADGGG